MKKEYEIFVYLGSAILILFLFNKLISSFGSVFTKSEEQKEIERQNRERLERIRKEKESIKKEDSDAFKNLVSTDKRPATFGVNQARIIASNFYEAMKGLGTNDELIERMIKQIKTTKDLQNVYNAFGVRDGMNLFQYLRHDLPERDRIFGRLSIKFIQDTFKNNGIRAIL